MKPWYREGLRFSCTGCGRCCTGPPGYVWVNRVEIAALAAHLRVGVEAFGRRWLRRVGRRYALLERPGGDCVFYRSGRGCTVHPVRPRQCRAFPFWPEHLRDPSAWDALKRECEGAGSGRLYPLEEIERIRRGRGDAAGV